MKKVYIKMIPLDQMSRGYELECAIVGSIILFDKMDELELSTDIFSPGLQELVFALGKYYKKHDHFNMVSFISFAKESLGLFFYVETIMFITGMCIGPNFMKQDQERLKEVYREDTMTLFKNKAHHMVKVVEEVYEKDIPNSKKIEIIRNRFNALCDVAQKKLGGK